MNIYFSGIGGVGIGSLAETARDVGYEICGSDICGSLMTKELKSQGANIFIGKQDGTFLEAQHKARPIDLVVYTAALPPSHPELVMARQLGIRTAKRDELLAEIIRDKGLKLIAVAGTHGKTTTTGMTVWALKQLGVPVSYSVGTTLSWGFSGYFDPKSEYFVYECDEFDRNFLHFEPFLSIITAIDYDHPDTFATPDDYRKAFVQFMEQSDSSLLWEKDLRYLRQPDIPASYQAFDELMDLSHIKLAGAHTRQNAFLVEQAVMKLFGERAGLAEIMDSFPGTARRFEKLGENLYSDYGHHPAEIAATLQMARELSDYVVLAYQPHQNIRQHEIVEQYTPDIFADADEVYWLPTYLSREDPELEILSPEQLSARLDGSKIHISEMDDVLAEKLQRHRDAGHLVLCMGAGTVDGWARSAIALLK